MGYKGELSVRDKLGSRTGKEVEACSYLILGPPGPSLIVPGGKIIPGPRYQILFLKGSQRSRFYLICPHFSIFTTYCSFLILWEPHLSNGLPLSNRDPENNIFISSCFVLLLSNVFLGTWCPSSRFSSSAHLSSMLEIFSTWGMDDLNSENEKKSAC